MIQLPNIEQTMMTCEDFLLQFPQVASYFHGMDIEHSLETYYEKDTETGGEGNPAQLVLRDLDCMDDVRDIFVECGIHLDADSEADPLDDEPDNLALTADEIAQHRQDIAGIRQGLQAIGVAIGPGMAAGALQQ
jgi:hypothetical protein